MSTVEGDDPQSPKGIKVTFQNFRKWLSEFNLAASMITGITSADEYYNKMEELTGRKTVEKDN